MIPEYNMKIAKRLDNSEEITGFYAFVGWTGARKHYIVPVFASTLYGIEVAPDTIKPMKVKPIKIYDDYMKIDRYKCPNCNRYISTGIRFCHWENCGMAIAWEEEQ